MGATEAPTVAEPWYAARLIWDVVRNALLPLSLRELHSVLPRFVAHIRRANERDTRPRQRDTIRSVLDRSLHPATAHDASHLPRGGAS